MQDWLSVSNSLAHAPARHTLCVIVRVCVPVVAQPPPDVHSLHAPVVGSPQATPSVLIVHGCENMLGKSEQAPLTHRHSVWTRI